MAAQGAGVAAAELVAMAELAVVAAAEELAAAETAVAERAKGGGLAATAEDLAAEEEATATEELAESACSSSTESPEKREPNCRGRAVRLGGTVVPLPPGGVASFGRLDFAGMAASCITEAITSAATGPCVGLFSNSSKQSSTEVQPASSSCCIMPLMAASLPGEG